MRPNLLDVLEAAYDLQADSQSWQENLVAAAGRAFPGTSGAYAYAYEIRDGAPRLVSGITGDACFLSAIEQGHTQADRDAALRAYTAPSHAAPTAAWLAEPDTGRPPGWLGPMWSRFGIVDVLGILATRPDGISLALGLGLTRAGFPDLDGRDGRLVAHRGTLLARHLETALVVREALAHGEVLAELDGSGRGDLQPRAASSLDLRDLPARLERALDLSHAGDERGLELWDELLRGRWSMVRCHSSAGRRRYLVVENPRHDVLRRLTALEREVVARVARGDANKVVAIELGCHPSTVANVLARAMRKLGCGSRTELALLARVLGNRSAGAC